MRQRIFRVKIQSNFKHTRSVIGMAGCIIATWCLDSQHSEETSQRWRAVGDTVSTLISPGIELFYINSNVFTTVSRGFFEFFLLQLAQDVESDTEDDHLLRLEQNDEYDLQFEAMREEKLKSKRVQIEEDIATAKKNLEEAK